LEIRPVPRGTHFSQWLIWCCPHCRTSHWKTKGFTSVQDGNQQVYAPDHCPTCKAAIDATQFYSGAYDDVIAWLGQDILPHGCGCLFVFFLAFGLFSVTIYEPSHSANVAVLGAAAALIFGVQLLIRLVFPVKGQKNL
jgi:hypothetical protein